jgi:carbamoyl-phosphate synthase/aspartate carbamoyltransferase
VHSANDLATFLQDAADVSRDHPVVISKFVEYAKEIEMDAVAKDGELLIHCISEHVENAGVHSGDATLVFPAQDLDQITIAKVEEATRKIAKALVVTGPFNIQFLAKDNQIKVIECNVRASRSFPFISKTLQYSLIEMATKAIMSAPIKAYPNISAIDYVGVKVAQFSFSRLRGADPILGVEMASTGEVACFGKTRYEAFLKALISTGFKLPKKNILLSVGVYKEKLEILPYAKILVSLGYNLFGTTGTAEVIHDINLLTLLVSCCT